MKNVNETSNDQIWEQIENEKRRDAFIKKVSKIAWGVTIGILMVFLFFAVNDIARAVELYNKEVIAFATIFTTAKPFLVTLGSVGLIIAILSTIGIFLRLRTASLLEIQQRLTNIEQMVVSQNNND